MTEKRTTKALASRIQVDYFKKFQSFKYWRRIALIALAAAAVLWIFFATVLQKKGIYTPGPVSDGHKMFGGECATCHVDTFDEVPDKACLECHTDRIHRKEQTYQPRCASCHVEHRETDLVKVVGPWNCASCHADLERKDGKKTEFAGKIRRLDKGHPEFRFFDEMKEDPIAVKLNHKVHLKPDLEGPDGKKVTLACRDCHGADIENDPEGVYRNAALNHEKQCRDCHALGFDLEFPGAVVPHKKPEEVREYLIQFYRQKIQADPTILLREPGEPERKRPGPAGFEEERPRVKSTEKHLFGKVCLECHSWQHSPGELPLVPKIEWRKKYLTHGRFDHAVHRPLACVSCHTKVPESEKSADILVPGVESCLDCHSESGSAGEACFTCHRYHGPGPDP